MSSGKKKKVQKKRTYSEGEVRRAIKEAADNAVARIMLICIVAARDEFDMDEDKLVQFMNTMQRYIGYANDGLVDMDAFSKTLKNSTGIDLRLKRW